MALLVEIRNVVFRYYSRFAQVARMAHNAPVPLAQVFWHLCWRAVVRPKINIGDLPLSGK
jgi:hypothetical protein